MIGVEEEEEEETPYPSTTTTDQKGTRCERGIGQMGREKGNCVCMAHASRLGERHFHPLMQLIPKLAGQF